MAKTLPWLARGSGIAIATFLALFALDAQRQELLPHLLPALVVLALAVLAWRRPMIAAIGFAACAAFYAAWARRADWFLVIGGPLLLASALNALAWRRAR